MPSHPDAPPDAEVGPVVLEVLVADITTLDGRRDRQCGEQHAACAAAASTARSIVRPDRSCRPSAIRSAAARPARPRSRAAIALPATHVIHAVGPVWHGGDAERGRTARRVLPHCAGARRRAPAGFDRVPGDLDRHLRLPGRPRRPHRGRHGGVRAVRPAAQPHARGVLLLRRRVRRATTGTPSPSSGWLRRTRRRSARAAQACGPHRRRSRAGPARPR